MKRSLIISCSMALLTSMICLGQQNNSVENHAGQSKQIDNAGINSSQELSQKNSEPNTSVTEQYEKQFPNPGPGLTGLNSDENQDIKTDEFMLFPNPTQGDFKISIPMIEGGKGWSIKIYTLDGRLIDSKVGHLDFDALEREFSINEKAGTYLVHLQIAGQNFVQKLVVF